MVTHSNIISRVQNNRWYVSGLIPQDLADPILAIPQVTGSRIVVEDLWLTGTVATLPADLPTGPATLVGIGVLSFFDQDDVPYGSFQAGEFGQRFTFDRGLYLPSTSDLYLEAVPTFAPAVNTRQYSYFTLTGRYEGLAPNVREQIISTSSANAVSAGYIADDVFTLFSAVTLPAATPAPAPCPVILPFGAPSISGLLSRLEELTSVFIDNQYAMGLEGTEGAATDTVGGIPKLLSTRGAGLVTSGQVAGPSPIMAEVTPMQATASGVVFPPGDGLSVDLFTTGDGITAGVLLMTLTGHFVPNAAQGDLTNTNFT